MFEENRQQAAFPGVAHFTGAKHHEGMSLRAWLAGQALPAVISVFGSTSQPNEIGAGCVLLADAVIAALGEKKDG